ncbi:hypothetical protein Tco_0543609 [Tanacetum coccineum]
MNYQPVRSENLANKHAGPKKANHSVGTEDNIDGGNSEIEAESAQDYFVLPIWSSYTLTAKSSKAKNAGEEPNKNPDLKTDEKPVDKEDQVFLDELARLKRQEHDANDAAEALRKEFAKDTEDLLLQAGAAKASSFNTVNTASTPVSTASPYGGLSFTDTDQDDSEIPTLEDMYEHPTDGIFTNASYDDEGAVADFTNLETIVNVSPIPTSRIDNDTMDYMETEDAQDVGRTSYVVHEEKESAEKRVSTEDPLSTAQPKVSTDKPEDSTDKPDEGTDKPKVSTDKEEVSTDIPDEGTVDQNEGRSATQTAPTTTTPTIFGDDETIAQVLIIMSQNKEKLKEKEKGVELKDVEETERPRPTSTRSLLTLKPLPKIDPKDKGKKMIEEEDESDTDSEDITEAEKKFKQLARDEEVARKVQEDWEAEEEVKKLAEEEATKAALSNEYDFIQARLNADKILAEKLQEEEREMYTIEQRAKFLHDTIAAQRRFLAQQRSEAIRNKPPSRNQLRNQMMTYLKHVGGKKHSDLKTKGFEEIKALYDKIKRSDDSFIAIGSAEDEKVIKEMNEQVADASKKRVKKDDSIKGEIKEEEGTRKRKLGIRKKMKSKKRKFTSKDDEELRLCLTIVSDEDKEVDYEILDKKYPIIEWRSEYLTTKPQYDETEEIEDVYLNVVIRSNRQRRYFSTLMAVLSILDRDDICAIYQLVMNRYQDETPEGFDKILWGDLIIMFNQSGNDEFWNAQQNWKIVSWKLHSSSGIHTIMTDEGIVIHMLVENKYPLKKEVLS